MSMAPIFPIVLTGISAARQKTRNCCLPSDTESPTRTSSRNGSPATSSGRSGRRFSKGSSITERDFPEGDMRHAMRSAQQSVGAWVVLVIALVSAVGCQNKTTAPTATGTGGSSPGDPQSVPVAALMTIAESSTLEQVAAGQTSTSNNYLGQSVTIPGTSSYNNLRFNWDGYADGSLSAPAIRGPLAAGDLFLLTQEYLGFPGNLGTSTPGY